MKCYLINYLIVSFLIGLAIAISGCEDDPTPVEPPLPTITELHTNGTFIPTSRSRVDGTMFITDENGEIITTDDSEAEWKDVDISNTDIGMFLLHNHKVWNFEFGYCDLFVIWVLAIVIYLFFLS